MRNSAEKFDTSVESTSAETAMPSGAQISQVSHDPALDSSYWDEIIRSELPRLLKMAIRLCSNPDLAEDCVAKALLKATEKRHQFQGNSKPSTWLHQIVINQCRDQLRKKKASRESPLPDTASFPSREETGEQKLSRREEQDRIRELVEKLPERQREVLILSVWDDRPASEIASLLEIDITAVYSNLSTARKKLKNWLQED